jgi:hypothetical protein
MATAAPVYEERRISVGRVFQRAFSAISLNPIVILGLALVVGALPNLIMTYFFVQTGLVTSSEAIRIGAISPARVIWVSLLSGLVMMVIAAFVQGSLTRAVVTANEGRRATFGESLGTGLQVILPLIGLSILFTIGVGIGFILLIVPGVILLLMWAVAVPALVVERNGVFAAFRRSAELTRGAKWKIFGLFLVLAVIYWLLSIVLGLVGLKMYGGTNAAGGLTVGNLLGSAVLGVIFNVLWGTIQPSLYVELRQAKEGTSAESLAQVFA